MVQDRRRLPLYEGLLQLFCKASLIYSPELKASIEESLVNLASSADKFARSVLLTQFAIKLILKNGMSCESARKFANGLVQYVFEKGFLKKAGNGVLYQGMTLNIYMLILTVTSVAGTEWKREVYTYLNERIELSL